MPGKITKQELSEELVTFIEKSGGSGEYKEDVFTASAGQTVFNTTMTYLPGAFRMEVFVDAAPQTLNEGFFEDNSNAIRLGEACVGGEKVRLRYILGVAFVGTDIKATQVTLPAIPGLTTVTNVADGMAQIVSKIEGTRTELINLINRGVSQ